ncbi:YscQ/HrcQ family type III secretion apparatus protein [Herbaspirillum sp. HC18]|nr:YscQ/HrcQ family type III secretion apparatus protein [Herbaspirillum sp. HC18]
MSEIDALADSGAIEDLSLLSYPPSGPENPGVLDPGAPAARLTVEHGRLTRLVGLGCSTRFAQPDATLTLELSHAESIDWSGALALAMPRGAIEIEHGVRFMRAMTQIDVTDEMEADDERWEWMQAALAGRLADTPFDGADRVLRSVKPNSDAVTLRATLRTGAHAVTTHMRGAAGAWLDVLQRAAWTPRKLPVAGLLALPYDSTVCVARHTLPAAALRAMAAGDIVLPDSAAFKCDGEGSIQIGGMRLRVRYRAPCMLDIIDMEGKLDAEELDASEGSEEEVQADFPAEEQAFPDDDGTPEEAQDEPPEEAAADGDASGLDTVPVTLDFELGKARMALGDMRALGPGVILPLRGGSPSSISIVTSRRELGRGELVDVDGRLGIRITQWWSR